IKQEMLLFNFDNSIFKGSESNPGFKNEELLNHFFNTASQRHPHATGNINCYVKIGHQTIFTTIKIDVNQIFDVGLGFYANWISLLVYQAKNGNIEESNNTILERGRFFSDISGEDLQKGQEYEITLIDSNRGYDEHIMLNKSDMPSDQYMFGCPV